MSELLHLIAVILSVPVVIVLAALIYNGAQDAYMVYRFGQKPEVDTSAAFLNWNKLKWLMISQTKQFVEKNPFIAQDLSEQVGYHDDGKP